MKVIIAGSRGINDYDFVLGVVADSGFKISSVLCGCALGVDELGEQIAEDFGIPVVYYPADWHTKGKAAGHIRNLEMAENAEALVAVWDNRSPGTRNMIDTAKRLGLRVYIGIY